MSIVKPLIYSKMPWIFCFSCSLIQKGFRNFFFFWHLLTSLQSTRCSVWFLTAKPEKCFNIKQLIKQDCTTSLAAMNGTLNQSYLIENSYPQEANYLQIVVIISFVFAILFIIIMASVTALGNSLLFYVVWKDKHLLNASNVFVLNLAFIGFLQTFSSMPLTMVYAIFRVHSHERLCDVREFLSDWLLCASFMALFLISLNRYAILVFGHNYTTRFSKRRSLIYVSVTWITAMIFATVMAVYRNASEVLREYDCSPRSVDNQSPRGAAAVKLLFTGCPFVATLALYERIIQNFLQRKRLYEKDNSSDCIPTTADRKRRAATKNIHVLSLTVAVLCAGQLLYVVQVFLTLLTGEMPRQVVITALGLYYFVNTSHAVIFGYLNKKFKRTFKRIFRRFFYNVHRWGTKKTGRKREIIKKEMNSFKTIDLNKYDSTSISSSFAGESSFSTSRGPLLLSSHNNSFEASKSLNSSHATCQMAISTPKMKKLNNSSAATRSRFPLMNDSLLSMNSSLHEELTRSRAARLFNSNLD